MRITINGQTRDLAAPISVQALAEQLQLNLKQVAIERNLEIIPRSRYGEVILDEGDRIEIVQFIGGG